MRPLSLLSLLIAAAALSGCVTAAIGLGGEAAVVAAQERSVGNAVDDTGTLIRIKNAFVQNDVNDLLANVEVKVVEGRVLLTGNVNKAESQIEAVRLTWQVEGVREVINEIQISDKAGFANYARDVWISTQVRSRFLFEKHLRSINYSVITVNQVVYLTGIAQDADELARATHIASTTSYVQRVVSYVRLKTDPVRNPPPL
jgi:osmotically-inducible protein OsmY